MAAGLTLAYCAFRNSTGIRRGTAAAAAAGGADGRVESAAGRVDDECRQRARQHGVRGDVWRRQGDVVETAAVNTSSRTSRH